MDSVRFHFFCACAYERLYCYGKARSFFYPSYQQFIIFAQLLDYHAFDNAKVFLSRTNDDFLTFYYIVLEKMSKADSSYSDLFEYVKDKIVCSFVDYYRKGVKP